MNVVRHILEESTCGTTQAAKMLQVSVGTIHHMIERGDLEAWFTVGGHRRIPLDSIRNCQMRRRMNISFDSLNPDNFKMIALASEHEIFTKLKMILAPRNDEEGKNVTFFSNPMQMMLDLDSINPQLILLDKPSLELLGGLIWFSQLRDKKKYKQTQVLMVGVALDPDEMAAALINKIDIISDPLDESWLNGYIRAAVTSWRLSCQF